MCRYSPFQNPVEDHYISALDMGRSLAREAEEWLRARRKMQAEEGERLEALRTVQRENRRAVGLSDFRLTRRVG